MKKRLISLIVFSVLISSGCNRPVVKDPDSYLYSVPEGSTLTLNRAITIPANLARRFFQNGKPVLKKNINIYYPHCSILMNTLVDYERTIQPTNFEIYKVMDEHELAQRYIYYAANFMMHPDGPSIVGYASYYYLRSSSVPDVRSLECVQWDDPVNVRYVTINEVKKSLGEYFTLTLKDD